MRSSAKYIWIFLIIFFVGGFLLAETSGLLGVSQVTPTTAVATVNGEDILATTWYNAINALELQATQQSSRSVTLDERRRIADEAFEQLVGDVILRQEYRRRGIRVTDEEVSEAARFAPPPAARAESRASDGRPVRSRKSISAFSPALPPASREFCSSSSRTIAIRFRARSCSSRSHPTFTQATTGSGASGAIRATRRRCRTSCSGPS